MAQSIGKNHTPNSAHTLHSATSIEPQLEFFLGIGTNKTNKIRFHSQISPEAQKEDFANSNGPLLSTLIQTKFTLASEGLPTWT